MSRLSNPHKRYLLVAYFVLLTMAYHPAYAYMDPGSGSLFVQLLFGGSAGIGLALRLYWRNIINFPRSGRNKAAVSKTSEQDSL